MPLCRNIHLPGKPTVDFDQFFDGESLDQEDLVVWLNLGMHHINRAEDSPHTLTNIATSSVLLTPFNFNDYDVGMEAQNAVLVQPAAAPGDLWLADENSVSQKFCLPAKPSPFKVRVLALFSVLPKLTDDVKSWRFCSILVWFRTTRRVNRPRSRACMKRDSLPRASTASGEEFPSNRLSLPLPTSNVTILFRLFGLDFLSVYCDSL